MKKRQNFTYCNSISHDDFLDLDFIELKSKIYNLIRQSNE